MKVGLVLGAGGMAGLAFHAGTLLALEADLGWDPRSAEVIVGSSAGSITAAALRAGLTTDDLAAWASAVAPLPAGRANRDVLDSLEQSGVRFARSAPAWPAAPALRWLAWVRHPRRVRLSTAAVTMLPHGVIDGRYPLKPMSELLPAWPARSMWITAVRTSDARRVVFGRRRTAKVTDAIAASCAIPGLFRPVRIDGELYIDGGAHSPTNADLLARASVDLAIVLSPMSGGTDGAGSGAPQMLRTMYARRLRRECHALRRAGIPYHIFEPDPQTVELMGSNPLDRKRMPGIVTTAFLHAGTRIAGSEAMLHALYRPPMLRTASTGEAASAAG